MAQQNKHEVRLTQTPAPQVMRVSDLKPGEFGIVTGNNIAQKGRILGRIWTSLRNGGDAQQYFALDNPCSTWTGSCNLEIRKLEPGEEIHMVIGE